MMYESKPRPYIYKDELKLGVRTVDTIEFEDSVSIRCTQCGTENPLGPEVLSFHAPEYFSRLVSTEQDVDKLLNLVSATKPYLEPTLAASLEKEVVKYDCENLRKLNGFVGVSNEVLELLLHDSDLLQAAIQGRKIECRGTIINLYNKTKHTIFSPPHKDKQNFKVPCFDSYGLDWYLPCDFFELLKQDPDVFLDIVESWDWEDLWVGMKLAVPTNLSTPSDELFSLLSYLQEKDRPYSATYRLLCVLASKVLDVPWRDVYHCSVSEYPILRKLHRNTKLREHAKQLIGISNVSY